MGDRSGLSLCAALGGPGGGACERFDEAVAALREADRLADHQPLTRSVLGWGLGAAGKRRLAQQLREELTAEAEREQVPAFLVAMIDIGLGEGDRALERMGLA